MRGGSANPGPSPRQRLAVSVAEDGAEAVNGRGERGGRIAVPVPEVAVGGEPEVIQGVARVEEQHTDVEARPAAAGSAGLAASFRASSS